MITEVGPDAIDDVMAVMERSFDPTFGEAWNRAQCLGILGLPGVWLSLDRADGTVRGFALARAIFDDAELLLIAVRPDARGHGVGRALLDHVIRTARERGATRLHLEVREGNPALRLYNDCGFEPVGRRRNYYSGNEGQTLDAITLVRPIDADG